MRRAGIDDGTLDMVKRIPMGVDPDEAVTSRPPRERGALDWFTAFAASLQRGAPVVRAATD